MILVFSIASNLQLQVTIAQMQLSKVFKILTKMKQKAMIHDFSVSLTSLEEMFVKMAQERQQVSYADTIMLTL